MTKYYAIVVHLLKRIFYRLRSSIFPNSHDKSEIIISCPDVLPPLKIYTYQLPKYYTRNEIYDLDIVYQTYRAISSYFTGCISTLDPNEADYFFLPINLHQFQYLNIDPSAVLKYCKYLGNRKNHLIVATGDFSQRNGDNHFGHAYTKQFPWLSHFNLLALESTNDLLASRDIGIIPVNTLDDNPKFNQNQRPLLYSFIGETDHRFLPPHHVRHVLKNILPSRDTFIGKAISKSMRSKLQSNFKTGNDYELVSRNSIFTLCPAGYGRWTYRFFQAISWGSIPVLISDTYLKPFASLIPYDDFCLTIKEANFANIDSIIRTIPKNRIKLMQNNLEKAQKYFTKEAFFTNLTKTLIDQKN